jgi:putative endonuclease
LSFWVYILRSQSTGRFYCGHTADLERRINQHNDPEYELCRTTKVFQGPWKMVWNRGCSERGEAMKLEKSIKKRGIGRFLEAQLVESRRRRINHLVGGSSPSRGARK